MLAADYHDVQAVKRSCQAGLGFERDASTEQRSTKYRWPKCQRLLKNQRSEAAGRGPTDGDLLKHTLAALPKPLFPRHREFPSGCVYRIAMSSQLSERLGVVLNLLLPQNTEVCAKLAIFRGMP